MRFSLGHHDNTSGFFSMTTRNPSCCFVLMIIFCSFCMDTVLSIPNVGEIAAKKTWIDNKDVKWKEKKQTFMTSTKRVSFLQQRRQQQQQQQQQINMDENDDNNNTIVNTATTTTTTETKDDDDDDDEDTMTLYFEGSHLYDRALPPVSKRMVTPERLLSFFQNPKQRDYLHKGGGNHIENIPVTPELFQEWKERCQLFPCPLMEPTNNNNNNHNEKEEGYSSTRLTILAIHSTMSLLPGLSIRAISYMGCRLLQQPKSSLPIYELTLIKDEFVPVGIKPLVWLVNQVTGVGSDSNDTSNSNGHRNSPNLSNDMARNDDTQQQQQHQIRKTHALTRISIQQQQSPQNDNNDHEISLILKYYGHVKVSCKIPRRLFKFMPMSQSKLVQTINQSITKQIQRESQMSIDPFRQGLIEFLSKPSTTTSSSSSSL